MKKIITLLILALLSTSCASRTDSSFLQTANMGIWNPQSINNNLRSSASNQGNSRYYGARDFFGQ